MASGIQKNRNGLTEKQQSFVDVYDGDIQKAAKAINSSYGYCRQLMTRPDIIAAVKERREPERAARIATRVDRQKFWTDIMEDAEGEMRDRLRASELLGKSEADFIERVEQSGPGGKPVENKWTIEIVKPGEK